MEDHDRLDAADVRRVLAGDAGAFEGIVLRHARRVHDLARRMLRDAHEAEDAAQQAFLNAFKALERFDLERPFRHWLLRITSNLCRNRIAARAVRRSLPRPRGGEDDLPEPACAAPTAEPLTRRATQEQVRAAIERLPEAYRLAVVLYYVHDCSIQEVAEIAGIPPATAKTHLHRAREALRGLLGGPETEPAPGGTES